jgi:hypothetical protein
MALKPPSSHHRPVPPASFQLIVTLACIAIFSGLLVATTFEVTKEPILKNRREALEKAVFTVLPEASSKQNFQLDSSGLKPLSDDAIGANVYAGYDDNGKLTGVAMEGAARGYQDVVKVLYGYQPEQQAITGNHGSAKLGNSRSRRPRRDRSRIFSPILLPSTRNLVPAGPPSLTPSLQSKTGTRKTRGKSTPFPGPPLPAMPLVTRSIASASEMLPNLQKHKNRLSEN